MKNRVRIEKLRKKVELLRKISWVMLLSLMAFEIALGIYFLIAKNFSLGLADLTIALWVGLYTYLSKEYYELSRRHDKLWDDYFELSDRFLKFLKEQMKKQLEN